MKWIQGILRNILLFSFYVTPIGWIYVIGIFYLDFVDWLTLPFEVKAERYMKIKNEKEKSTSMSDMTQPIFGITRLFKEKRVATGD